MYMGLSRTMSIPGNTPSTKRRTSMRTTSVAGAFAGSLLVATALTPVRAADMTNERLLNPQREPQNWILHHGNYQGHRLSALKEINAETVKNLKPAFTVALSGFQSGGRYPSGRSRPLRWSRTASCMCRTAGARSTQSTSPPARRAPSSGRWTPAPTGLGRATSRAVVSTTAALRCGRTR
jgi:hypothetical protein